MGNWYKVTKRINGRLYDYWQRTERHGKQVKTFNKYIGPHGTTAALVVSQYDELAHKADASYAYANSLSWDHPDKHPAIDRYHEAFDAVSKIQADTLGRPIDQWGNTKGTGGGQMYRRDFVAEARELANRNDEESDREKAQEDANFTPADAAWLQDYLDTTFKEELRRNGVEIHEPSPTTPRLVEEAIQFLTPSTANLTPEDKRRYEKHDQALRREDEHIQYGPRAARIRKQEAAVRKAKRETKGIKSLNPFMARMLKKKKP
jgi:hypothetical protein